MSSTSDATSAAQAPEPQYHRRFGPKSTALEVLKDIDLAGKTMLITGTTSGIGKETARALALHGAHVVMACRNIVESEKVRDEITQEAPAAKVDLLNVDLSSLQSVRAAADEFIAKEWPLHVLILNAGVFAPLQKATIDGHESTFAVNHLAHFLLTRLLLPRLRESAPSRIVIVSSDLHARTGINPTAPINEQLVHLVPSPTTREFAFRLYACSKLCNILMAQRLHRDEFKANGIHIYVLHPGSLIGTNIGRAYGFAGRIFNRLIKPFVKTLEQGAATTVYCAASPDIQTESGKFYESCWDDEKILAKPLAHNAALQDALWEKSLELIAEFEKTQK